MNIVIQSNTTLGYLTRRRRNGRLHAIENHPAQRDSSAIAGYNLKVESENTPPQLHSGIYNLEMGHIGPMGFMGRKPVMNNRPAQPDSPAIAGSLLKVESENTHPQPHSGMSILRFYLTSQTGPTSLTEQQTTHVEPYSGMSNLKVESENTPTQPHSGMSNLKVESENTPPQPHSGMSNLRFCLTSQTGPTSLTEQQTTHVETNPGMSNLKVESENTPPQPHSGMSNLGMGLMGHMGTIGLMGQQPVMKNYPARRDSGISILKNSPYRPLAVRLVPQSGDPYRPLVFKTTPAQRDSGMSKLGMGLIGPMGPMGPMGLMGKKPVMKNGPAQQGSGNSILKACPYCPSCPSCPLVFKTSPAQRDSGNSNFGRLSGHRAVGFF